MKPQSIGTSLAQKVASGKAVRQRRSPLLVRSDWVLEQIKQRENAVGVKQLEQANYERWNAINPEWTKYGPELALTSRGTARAELLEGLIPPEVAVLGGTLGGMAFVYASWKLWKGPKAKKKRYETVAVVGAAAWLLGRTQLQESF